MEEEKEVIQEKTNNNYLAGAFGAILGGIIGAIPWTLLYVFANLNSAWLAILVGLGAVKGYTLFKGKVNKGAKKIVSITSLLVLLFVDLIGIPLIYTVMYNVDLEAFYTQMKVEIIADLIFTLFCGILGIAFAIDSINKILAKQQIKENDNNNEKIDEEELRKAEINNSLSNEKKKEIEILRKVFGKLNALDKKSGVEKQAILEEFEKENVVNPEKLFKKYKNLDIIKKSKGKFYYSRNSEKFATKGYWVAIMIVVAIVVWSNGMNDIDTDYNNDNNNLTNSIVSEQGEQVYDFNGKNITINVPEEFTITEENGMYFIEKEDSYAVVYLYDKSELVDGLTLEDGIKSVEDYIYGVYEAEEKVFMEEYSNLNKKAYKLSFDSVEGIYKVKVNSYLTETPNYIIEVHLISEANKASENESKYENMLNSIVEKNNVEE